MLRTGSIFSQLPRARDFAAILRSLTASRTSRTSSFGSRHKLRKASRSPRHENLNPRSKSFGGFLVFSGSACSSLASGGGPRHPVLQVPLTNGRPVCHFCYSSSQLDCVQKRASHLMLGIAQNTFKHRLSAFFFAVEANAVTFLVGWRCELPYCIEDYLELVIVLALHFPQLSRQFLIAGQHLAQANEGSNDRDVYLDRTLAVEHAGKHGDTLFGKGIWRIAAPTPPV